MRLPLFTLTTILSLTEAQQPSALSAAESAFQTLQQWYNPSNGLYGTCPSCWWQSANVITTLSNLMQIDSSLSNTIESVLQNTFSVTSNQDGCADWMSGNYDDDGWWALAWIAAYDATSDQRYLEAAEQIFDSLQRLWGTPCGQGGMWWSQEKTYVNAITNELFISIAAHLSNRPASRGAEWYAAWAERSWEWFENSGMINSKGLVNDGLDGSCKNNGGTVFTYNQGVILGALVELYRQTSSSTYLSTAHQLAAASISTMTGPDQVLREQCGTSCDADQTQFKGIYIRNLMALNVVDPGKKYEEVISTSAKSLWEKDRSPQGVIGVQWQGPFVPQGAGFSTQSSGLDALVASAVIGGSVLIS